MSDTQTGESSWCFKTLNSGIKFSHAPLFADDRFYLGVIYKSGARYEVPSRSGISHFLEHMMFRGSKNYPSFISLANAFEWLAGDWNAETGYEHTEYSFNGIYSTADNAIKLFAEFLKEPSLLNLELERQIILREIDEELNEFGHWTDLNLHMSKLFWPDSSLALPITGSKETVSKINLDELRAFRNQFYTNDRMAISIVGGREPLKLIESVERHFEGYTIIDKGSKPETSVRAVKGPHCKWVENTDSQQQVLISFLCEGEWSEKEPIYDLIVRILSDGYGAALPFRLREELGLVYGVDMSTNLLSDCGTIDIEATVNKDKIDKFVEESLQVISSFCQKGPSQEDFAKAKHRALIATDLTPTEPEALGMYLGWHHLNDRPASLEKDKTTISKLDMTSLVTVARELFTRDNLAITVLGPKDKGIEQRLLNISNLLKEKTAD